MVAKIPANREVKEFDLIQEFKALQADIVARIAAGASDLKGLQTQVDAIDKKLMGGPPAVPGGGRGLADILKENDSVAALVHNKKGRALITLSGDDARIFERKTTITSSLVGSMTTGVLPIERMPGITREATQQLTIRDLLTATPTTFQVIDFVKVLQPLTIASPVPEASLKPENQLNFTSVSERIRTIATWLPASRQILDDMEELMSFLRSMMPYYVDLAEEQQLLFGDATVENLHGLVPQASAFNTSLLPSSYNKIDIIGRVIEQITMSKELAPTFVVMNPKDWWDTSGNRFRIERPERRTVCKTVRRRLRQGGRRERDSKSFVWSFFRCAPTVVASGR
jgi:HK97 family phage major capsid protein